MDENNVKLEIRKIQIEEYKSIRSELMKRQDARLLMVGFSITGIAAVLGLIFKGESTSAMDPLYSIIFALLIVVIAVEITKQQSNQLDTLFINLNVSESLSNYHSFYTDSLSRSESNTRILLAGYYIIVTVAISLIFYIIYFSNFNSPLPLLSIQVIFMALAIASSIQSFRKGLNIKNNQIKILEDSLKDENKETRIRAADALGEIGDINSISSLIDTFDDKSRKVRNHAGKALLKIGENRVDIIKEPLLNALKHEKPSIRMWAAKTLGSIKDKTVYIHLKNTLNTDDDGSVRLFTLRAIWEIKKEDASQIYINSLKDEYEPVKKQSMEYIEEIKDKNAIEPLIQLMLNEKESHSIRENTAKTLIEIKDKKTANILIPELRHIENQEDLDNSLVVMVFIGMPEIAMETLLETLKSNADEDIKIWIPDILANIGNESVIEPLIEATKDDNITINMHAKEALNFLRDVKKYEGIPDFIELDFI